MFVKAAESGLGAERGNWKVTVMLPCQKKGQGVMMSFM
jgi:hypothetical protein